jgi:hypothetical protein
VARGKRRTTRARLVAVNTQVTVDWIYWGERAGLPFRTVQLLGVADNSKTALIKQCLNHEPGGRGPSVTCGRVKVA